MKKNFFINTILIVAPIVIILILNRYHFLYNTACRIGFVGLKLLAMYALILIVVVKLFQIVRKSKKHGTCSNCKAAIQKDWEICPYCGMEDFERRVTNK